MAKSNRPAKRIPRSRQRKMRARRARRGNVPEWASLSETIKVTSDTVGQVYNNNDVQLAMFLRASAVAQGYQFFRIKKVSYKYTPLLDTFASTGNTQVPYLYWVINKAGTEYPGVNRAWMMANGAKPIRFDDKSVTIKYAPNVVLDVLEAQTPAATEQPNFGKRSPWLNTTKDAFLAQGFQPSQVSHTGHYVLVESPGSTIPMNYETYLTAEFEFKKPNAAVLPSENLLPVVSVTKKDV